MLLEKAIHLARGAVEPVNTSQPLAYLNSNKYFSNFSIKPLGSQCWSSWINEFWYNHNNHITIALESLKSKSLFSHKLYSHYPPLHADTTLTFKWTLSRNHTFLATEQSLKIWTIYSYEAPQTKQSVDSTIFIRIRFSMVENEFVHTLQIKSFTLFGTPNFQIFFAHKLFDELSLICTPLSWSIQIDLTT